MPYKVSVFILLSLCFNSCSPTLPKPKEEVKVMDSLVLQVETKNNTIYTLPEEGIIDSTLMQNTRFLSFKSTMEDLNKLNPEGIEPFVISALQACQSVERTPLPQPFDAPDISARLKVVKTQLIKVRYFSQENNQEELNKALEGLYRAYNDYLRRIHSFSEEETIEEEEILLNE